MSLHPGAGARYFCSLNFKLDKNHAIFRYFHPDFDPVLGVQNPNIERAIGDYPSGNYSIGSNPSKMTFFNGNYPRSQ